METHHLIRRGFLKAATPVLFGAGTTMFASCSSQQQQLEDNKAIIVREVEDFYNAKKISVADEIYSPELVTHSPNAPNGDLDKFKKDAVQIFKAFTGSRLVINDLFAYGDRVAKRWTFTGTHSSEWQGIPATGKKFTVQGINIFRISNGKIDELWEMMDILGMLQQLGVIPPLGQA